MKTLTLVNLVIIADNIPTIHICLCTLNRSNIAHYLCTQSYVNK